MIPMYAKFTKFCLPSYVLIAGITLLLLYDVVLGKPFLFFLLYFVLTYAWCLFLNLLWNTGHKTVSWVLILFPFILFLGFIWRDLTGTDLVQTIHDVSEYPLTRLMGYSDVIVK